MNHTICWLCSAILLPAYPPPTAPTTVATVRPVPPPTMLPSRPPPTAPRTVPAVEFAVCTACERIDSTTPARDAGSWTEYTGGVEHPASSIAIQATTAIG